MLKICRLLRKYPLTAVCVAAIWYLSFFTPPHTELDNVRFVDKWAHVLMYGGTCAVFWAEHLLRGRRTAVTRAAVAAGWLAPLLMGGAIELLQAYCTGGRRSGDWLDLCANAVGISLALGAAFLLARHRPRQ